MKSKLTLFLIGITLTLTSCGGASTNNPKDVANAFLKAMREQNLSLIKETSTENVSTRLNQYFASATEKNIKELSSFNTTYESQKRVGNVYFERFTYGKQKRDTMVLKIVEEAKKWKVVGVTWKPFKN